jgi:hypothetical protein
MNKLERLKGMTTVVADTGDIDAIAQSTPTDATTNPSLLLKEAQQSQSPHLLEDALRARATLQARVAQRQQSATYRTFVSCTALKGTANGCRLRAGLSGLGAGMGRAVRAFRPFRRAGVSKGDTAIVDVGSRFVAQGGYWQPPLA